MKELEIIAIIFIDATLGKTREELDSSFYIQKLDQHPLASAHIARAKLITSTTKKKYHDIR